MTKYELAKQVYHTSYIVGDFKLRSGQTSNEYFDKYLFESNPEILKQISGKMIELLPSNYDYLGALEMGAIPIATAIALQTDDKVVYVRKEAKEYGTAKFAEGPLIKDKRLCLIEDVVTSGGQLVNSAKMLRSAGAIIDYAVCVIDRESGGTEALKDLGIELISLFKMSELKD